MPSDVELRRINRTLEHIDRKLGAISQGMLAINNSLVLLIKLIEEKEANKDGTT